MKMAKYEVKDFSGDEVIAAAVAKANTFLKLEQYDKAKEIFQKLADDYPEQPVGWFGLIAVATEMFENVEDNEEYENGKKILDILFESNSEFKKYSEPFFEEYENLRLDTFHERAMRFSALFEGDSQKPDEEQWTVIPTCVKCVEDVFNKDILCAKKYHNDIYVVIISAIYSCLKKNLYNVEKYTKDLNLYSSALIEYELKKSEFEAEKQGEIKQLEDRVREFYFTSPELWYNVDSRLNEAGRKRLRDPDIEAALKSSDFVKKVKEIKSYPYPYHEPNKPELKLVSSDLSEEAIKIFGDSLKINEYADDFILKIAEACEAYEISLNQYTNLLSAEGKEKDIKRQEEEVKRLEKQRQEELARRQEEEEIEKKELLAKNEHEAQLAKENKKKSLIKGLAAVVVVAVLVVIALVAFDKIKSSPNNSATTTITTTVEAEKHYVMSSKYKSINIWSRASTSSEKVVKISDRSIKLVPTGNEDDDWIEVTTPDGKKGWVSKSVLTLVEE